MTPLPLAVLSVGLQKINIGDLVAQQIAHLIPELTSFTTSQCILRCTITSLCITVLLIILYHMICPFKMQNFMIFGIFIELCTHMYN